MKLARAPKTECLSLAEMTRPFEDPAEAAEFARLPVAQQRRVTAWLDALRPVVDGPRTGRGVRLAKSAQSLGETPRTARNRFDALQREGWRGLVDGRQAKAAAAIADVDCSDPRAFHQWIKGLAENYGGNLKMAQRAAVALWRAARSGSGKDIPGYKAIPRPGLAGIPAGWSYGNLARIAKLTKYERSVSGVGRAAARQYAPMVIRSRVGLECGQCYMIDDVWHDVECHLLGSQREFVRPMELAVIDVFSASKICYGLKPRRRDDATGKRINLRGSDMRFLIAHLACNIGFHPDQCVIIGEHGTAKVESHVADLLYKYSGGAIRLQEGGIQNRPAILGAWGGRRGGNPRVKAALESSHRLIHFAAKWLPGQTGGDSRNNLPEDHHGREAYFGHLCKAVDFALQGLEPERAKWILNEIQAPVMSYWSYAKIVDQLYPIIEQRTDHDLEGWQRAGLMLSGFRTDLSSTEFFPYSAIEQLPRDQAAAVRMILANSPNLNISRQLSPREVWNAGSRRLRRFPPEFFAQICGPDLAVERRVRNHAIRFEDASVERGRTFSFPAVASDPRGREILLKDGEAYNTVINPFDPSKLYILDARFEYIGYLSEQIVVSHIDMQGAHAAMGQAARAEIIAMLPYRMRHADRAGEEARTRAHNKALLSGMVLTPEERAVRDRARDDANDGDMDALLSACSRPDPDAGDAPEAPADLSAIFGPPPGSQD